MTAPPLHRRATPRAARPRPAPSGGRRAFLGGTLSPMSTEAIRGGKTPQMSAQVFPRTLRTASLQPPRTTAQPAIPAAPPPAPKGLRLRPISPWHIPVGISFLPSVPGQRPMSPLARPMGKRQRPASPHARPMVPRPRPMGIAARPQGNRQIPEGRLQIPPSSRPPGAINPPKPARF
jgi:hypothetical protein